MQNQTTFAIVLFIATFSATVAHAQPGIDCPDESTINYGPADLILPGSPPSTYLLPLLPCQTVAVKFIGSVVSNNAQPAGAGVSVSITNAEANPRPLVTRSFTCWGGCTEFVPSLTDQFVGWPLPGTKGEAGLPRHVVVSHISNTANFVSASYRLEITLKPRFDYNTGGTGFDSAPTLTLPRQLSASLHHWETGQYYKITLNPGAALRVTGIAGCASATSCNLIIRLRNPRTGQTPSLLSTGIENTESFTASVFTNSEASPGDFLLWVSAGNQRPLRDLRMMVETDALKRTLGLFIDVDGQFNPHLIASDADNYLPGTDVFGATVALPQNVLVIAGYVDSANRIVLPSPGVTRISFALSGTSAFRGYAMNAGTDEGPDFQLSAASAPLTESYTASVTLQCLDYGAFTTITASDSIEVPTALRLPRDADNDWLPDVGWQAGPDFVQEVFSPCTTDATCDTDYLPAVSGHPQAGHFGDGFTSFEEFRGFIVRGDHRRTNPSLRDLFVSSTLDEGIFYAYPNLPMAVHRVRDAYDSNPEYDPQTRVMNMNYSNAGSGGNVPGHADQRALRVLDGIFHPQGAWGCAIGINYSDCWDAGNTWAPPNDISRLDIYTENIAMTAAAQNFSTEQVAKCTAKGHRP